MQWKKSVIICFQNHVAKDGSDGKSSTVDGHVYITASNPSVSPNNFPALVRATLEGTMVVTEPVLYGNATAIDIPTGGNVTLNLQDPDSLTAQGHRG